MDEMSGNEGTAGIMDEKLCSGAGGYISNCEEMVAVKAKDLKELIISMENSPLKEKFKRYLSENNL